MSIFLSLDCLFTEISQLETIQFTGVTSEGEFIILNSQTSEGTLSSGTESPTVFRFTSAR